jgi:UDP-N-acetylmuramoyl-tripeptide--D-alanyl-D-alanine ligase
MRTLVKYKTQFNRWIGVNILSRMTTDTIIRPYLAFWARLVLLRHAPVIVGITGSVGKTTTTEMIGTILAHERSVPLIGPVAWTSTNMNDEIGVAMTVLRYTDWFTDHPFWRLVAVACVPFRALKLMASLGYPRVLVLEFGAQWKGLIERLAAHRASFYRCHNDDRTGASRGAWES